MRYINSRVNKRLKNFRMQFTDNEIDKKLKNKI